MTTDAPSEPGFLLPLNHPLTFSRIRQGTIVRPMSPFGTYWKSSSLLADAAYVVRDDLIFTACHFDNDAHEDEYYTEHDEPTPEEIRLLASLALPIGIDRGFMAQYPHTTSIRIAEVRPLDDPHFLQEIETKLRSALGSANDGPRTDAPLPPSPYNHFHWPLPITVHRQVYAAIDPHNHLLIRGLGTWLKGAQLHCHQSFAEEANYPLWISLDASQAIVFEELRATGLANPTSLDAQNYIHDAFGEERSGLKYFEEFYEDRIMTIHPQNRFGIFGFAPLGHDEFYWLHNGLREVFRYLLLESVIDPQAEHDTEEFWADMQARAGKQVPPHA